MAERGLRCEPWNINEPYSNKGGGQILPTTPFDNPTALLIHWPQLCPTMVIVDKREREAIEVF